MNLTSLIFLLNSVIIYYRNNGMYGLGRLSDGMEHSEHCNQA